MDRKLPIRGVQYSKELVKVLDSKDLNSIKKWAIHTGSKKIIKLVSEGCSIEQSKTLESYEILNKYGNSTLCSLPLILERILEKNSGSLNYKDKVALLGFGSGFTASLAVFEKL